MDESEYLPLSWLSQMNYCPRRAALLLNERAWEESVDTAKGRAEHERVHTQRVERRGTQVKLYEYTVCSEDLGLIGKCDCIEAAAAKDGCLIPAISFPVKLYPIEYKHGAVREEKEYEIQLCAQAICLEEMFHTAVSEGALFFISSHRRMPVSFTPELRANTRETALALHQLRTSLSVPKAEYGTKCRRCSLLETCMPRVNPSAQQYCRIVETEAKGTIKEGKP